MLVKHLDLFITLDTRVFFNMHSLPRSALSSFRLVIISFLIPISYYTSELSNFTFSKIAALMDMFNWILQKRGNAFQHFRIKIRFRVEVRVRIRIKVSVSNAANSFVDPCLAVFLLVVTVEF